MKKLFLLLFLLGILVKSHAQTENLINKGGFKTGKMLMQSKPYKPDNWEKTYYETALKTAFPSNLNRSPAKYKEKLIY